jgi:NADH-quinone oxidoreductase subunit J
MADFLFYLLAAVALGAALNVLLRRKVFYSAISLIVCLAALAGIYLLLDAQFIAAVQVIVYAGAIMVLFLFVIMLLDPFSAAVLVDKRRYLARIAPLLGALALAVLVPMLVTFLPSRVPRVVGKLGGGGFPAIGNTAEFGRALFTDYLLPFEATSALILVAIIGAVVLAKRRV